VHSSEFLIGITGKMGSGKSTVAKIVTRISETKGLHIAGKLKDIIRDLELPYKREVLQDTGDFFRRWDKLVWIKAVLKEAKTSNHGVIIDDIRYNIESDELKKNNYRIIRVYADADKRRKRIAKRDNIDITDEKWINWSNHPTESEIDEINVDFEINNNKDLKNLEKEIRYILKQITNTP
jgi:dephospho-CoA kinase